MNLGKLRTEYTKAKLTRENLHPDPFLQLEQWLKEVTEAGIDPPNAMTLATAACPSLRTVLLKYFDRRGLTFFTNYESLKAKEMDENPQVALSLLWMPLERQVIINGKAERIPLTESIKYFSIRPRDSQIGTSISRQGSWIPSRKMLLQLYEEMKRKLKGRKVPLPTSWGGYRAFNLP